MATEIKKIKNSKDQKDQIEKSAKVNIAKTIKPKKSEKTVKVIKQDKKDEPKKKETNEISEVFAKARYIHVSPRKVRLVIDQIRNLDAETALNKLRFINKAATQPVYKLLKSGIANAENNFNLDVKDLFIKKIVADEGPTLKRYRPRAHGRSAAIRKRTSHISLILGIRAGAKPAIKRLTDQKAAEAKIVSPDEVKKSGPKSGGMTPSTDDHGKDSKGFMKGIFQRKTG